MDELGEGPGSRLLLIAMEGGTPAELAAQSRALARSWRRAGFRAGGQRRRGRARGHARTAAALPLPAVGALSTRGRWMPPLCATSWTQRVQDLGSPTAGLIEPLLPADPTLEMLKLAERWQPASAPQRLHGVWFNRAGDAGAAGGADARGGLRPDRAAARRGGDPGRVRRGARRSATRLAVERARCVRGGDRRAHAARGCADRHRRHARVDRCCCGSPTAAWKAPLLGALPLATAGLAGLGAVALLFDGVHGITVAFGFTLIGVAQDYPIHLFSHQRPGVSPLGQRARAVADAGHRRGVDLHRVPDLPGVRRGRPAAARGVHHRRAGHRGAGHALPVAGA